jgi:hypothetical protein
LILKKLQGRRANSSLNRAKDRRMKLADLRTDGITIRASTSNNQR